MRSSLVLRTLGIGFATGLRTMTGPAAVFRGPGWNRVLPLMAIGEYVVDKLPGTPSRTMPPALIARALAGAIAGSTLAKTGGGGRALGAVLGVAGALGASYAGLAYRSAAPRYVPAWAAALLEDGVAIGLARAVASGS